jgi:hypothetical protein
VVRDRLKLHDEFIDILGTRGEEISRVYFQPPGGSEDMEYPCIRYSLGVPDLKRANDKIYANKNRYEVIVIDYDPDSTIPGQILERFQYVSPGTPYTADNLYHWPLTLYY